LPYRSTNSSAHKSTLEPTDFPADIATFLATDRTAYCTADYAADHTAKLGTLSQSYYAADLSTHYSADNATKCAAVPSAIITAYQPAIVAAVVKAD
jgi:hypothetical protein